MGNVPNGAMSTPYGGNSRSANELIDTFDRQSGNSWGKYGDAPKKYTNLPKSEADALIAKEEREFKEKQLEAYVQECVVKALEAQKVETEKKFQDEINSLKMKLEIQMQVNEQLKAIFQK